MIFVDRSKNKSCIGNRTDNDFIKIGDMFILDGDFYMKVKNINNEIAYVCLNNGRFFSYFSIMELDYENVIKINGKLEWWKIYD